MKYFILILSILLSVEAFAGAVQTGKITRLLVHNNASSTADSAQRVIIQLGSDISNGLCSDKRYWGMYLKSEVERAQYSMLLASYMAGKTVKIWGNPEERCVNSNERVRNVEIVD